MNARSNRWWILTPQGALRAFSSPKPDAEARALQGLLTSDRALDEAAFLARSGVAAAWLDAAAEAGWVESLPRPLLGPDARLDDFLQHVIPSLSGVRRAVLASDGGFCLGACGLAPDEAEALSVAAADFGAYAERQQRRGWGGARGFVSFHSDPEFLLPNWSFVPLWVDGNGYWLIVGGEPLLNNAALVELLWGLKLAGERYSAASAQSGPKP